MTEERLRTLSKQELIDFIQRKGSEYKTEQRETTLVVTRDSQDQIPQLMESIRQATANKQAKII